MSTAMDLSTAFSWQGASTNKRLTRGYNPVPIVYQMTGYDTVALTTITWFSYGDPQNDPPPSPNPVINVSATRIR
jgi:hypothetical protein